MSGRNRLRIVRSPLEYRSLGIILDRGRKPYGRNWQLVVSLWWVDVALDGDS